MASTEEDCRSLSDPPDHSMSASEVRPKTVKSGLNKRPPSERSGGEELSGLFQKETSSPDGFSKAAASEEEQPRMEQRAMLKQLLKQPVIKLHRIGESMLLCHCLFQRLTKTASLQALNAVRSDAL